MGPSNWQAFWILAKKDFSLLLRDRRAAFMLIIMPLIFILVLGMALGESFGQKPDDRLRITLVDEDRGFIDVAAAQGEAASLIRGIPLPNACPDATLLGTLAFARILEEAQFPFEPWSIVVLRDLAETAEIRVELLPDLQTAQKLSAES